MFADSSHHESGMACVSARPDPIALTLSRWSRVDSNRRRLIPSSCVKKEKYVGLNPTWPVKGRHILAYFTESSLIVYQAYRPAIAKFALENQRFGGEFSFNRMSWIKPNFLWMMYRSGWAQKEGQEHVLAVELSRTFFDEILSAAVASSYDPMTYSTRECWQRDVQCSDVRLQWDPDHDPLGRPTERRALQLGLRGATLKRYATTEIISITNVTPFVIEQRSKLADIDSLHVPHERVYTPSPVAAKRIALDAY